MARTIDTATKIARAKRYEALLDEASQLLHLGRTGREALGDIMRTVNGRTMDTAIYKNVIDKAERMVEQMRRGEFNVKNYLRQRPEYIKDAIAGKTTASEILEATINEFYAEQKELLLEFNEYEKYSKE